MEFKPYTDWIAQFHTFQFFLFTDLESAEWQSQSPLNFPNTLIEFDYVLWSDSRVIKGLILISDMRTAIWLISEQMNH